MTSPMGGPAGRGAAGPARPGARRVRPDTSVWHAELAWLGDHVASDVLIEIQGERIATVAPRTPQPTGATRLPGLTLPGLANVHSHAFHRALRGRAQTGRGTFWTWREQMYQVAERLDPDSYRALARAVYAEMALAGVTCVGEFHYVHHGPGGVPYDEPNIMGEALIEAAADAGIRITLLDTCYLTGGIGRPLSGTQRRFGDGDAESWARRVTDLADGLGADGASADGVRAAGGDASGRDEGGRGDGPAGPGAVGVGEAAAGHAGGETSPAAPRAGSGTGGHALVGAAIHSVRAVPPEHLRRVALWAFQRRTPLHVHLSEQPAENDACRAAYGKTPTRLLVDAGVLRPRGRGVAVHATHLSDEDVALLGATMTAVCACPTTERDLADGLGRMGDLTRAGSPLCLGSDQHAVIDMFEEARGLEMGERLRTGRRGHWTAGELLAAATWNGHAALGWPAGGRIEPGAYGDLVTVRLDSVRLAGTGAAGAAEAAVFAATAADVRHVVVSGREVVRDGRHLLVDDVPGELASAIAAVTAE